MKKNWLLSIGLLLVLSLFLAACGGGNNSTEGTNNENSAGSEDPEYISFLTGGTSGTYYPLGGAIAKIIGDETGIQADAVSSNASRSEERRVGKECRFQWWRVYGEK